MLLLFHWEKGEWPVYAIFRLPPMQLLFLFMNMGWLACLCVKSENKSFGNVLGNSKPSLARVNYVFSEFFLSKMVPTYRTIYL